MKLVYNPLCDPRRRREKGALPYMGRWVTDHPLDTGRLGRDDGRINQTDS